VIAPRGPKLKPTRTAEFAARTGRDWRNLIEAAMPAGALRGSVIAIVWWDHFATRDVADRWPELDEFFIKGPDNPSYAYASGVTPAELCQGLISIGYDPREAEQRSRDPADFIAWRLRGGKSRGRPGNRAGAPNVSRGYRRVVGVLPEVGQGAPQGAA
jgi:hypothetical protein